ncbi:unnamed protein product, partial [Phaeothamnion confervicola]
LKRNGDAAAEYRKCIARHERLLAFDPANVEWETDLVVGLYKLARTGDERRTHLTRALTILRKLKAAQQLPASLGDWPGVIEAELGK